MIIRGVRVAALIILSVLCSGCLGPKWSDVEAGEVVDFQKRVTTYQDVLDKLGAPSSRTVDSQGDVYLHYIQSSYTMKPETFLPVVGDHVGGMNNQYNAIVLAFGRDLILKDIVFSNVKTDAVLSH